MWDYHLFFTLWNCTGSILKRVHVAQKRYRTKDRAIVDDLDEQNTENKNRQRSNLFIGLEVGKKNL